MTKTGLQKFIEYGNDYIDLNFPNSIVNVHWLEKAKALFAEEQVQKPQADGSLIAEVDLLYKHGWITREAQEILHSKISKYTPTKPSAPKDLIERLKEVTSKTIYDGTEENNSSHDLAEKGGYDSAMSEVKEILSQFEGQESLASLCKHKGFWSITIWPQINNVEINLRNSNPNTVIFNGKTQLEAEYLCRQYLMGLPDSKEIK